MFALKLVFFWLPRKLRGFFVLFLPETPFQTTLSTSRSTLSSSLTWVGCLGKVGLGKNKARGVLGGGG